MTQGMFNVVQVYVYVSNHNFLLYSAPLYIASDQHFCPQRGIFLKYMETVCSVSVLPTGYLICNDLIIYHYEVLNELASFGTTLVR